MGKVGIGNRNVMIVTAGPTYIDIDAYACCVAMVELLNLKGENVIAYSKAPNNYSVCSSLIEEGQMSKVLPCEISFKTSKFIIVDVSDPEYIKGSVPLNQIVEIYDHHAGFEDYWTSHIGKNAHIEFIGAAATLIYREWKKAGLQDKMKRSTALLLIAAILDNTLYLTSQNTTAEDIEVFNELCSKENIDEEWCAAYFSEVQDSIEADLKNALFGDMKHLLESKVLPLHIAQLCVWDAQKVLERISDIRDWFNIYENDWMLNIIDIKQHCSYFACDNHNYQNKIESVFNVSFDCGVAKTPVSYLRKEIIKKAEYDD